MASFDDLHPDGLYHLATEAEWERYQASGLVEPASLATEGFVHCSWGRQVAGTVARHFAGEGELAALLIDVDALGSLRLVEEDSYSSGQRFPHIYGPVPSSAVSAVVTLDQA